jgi:hypothetical protein
MGYTPKGPESVDKRTGTDTEGHSIPKDVKSVHVPSDEPGTRPQEVIPRATDEDDVEGHNFGHNSMLSRNAAQSREREVQRHLKEHDLKSEARRPFFKRGS